MTTDFPEKKWSADIGCPDGVFRDFNIDAKINAAYIVIGMLYGEGDYSKTLEISTRCGQDSDCNPASAGGILGTMLGYSKIPDFWKKGVFPVEDMDFKYTTMSLNDVYDIGTNQALKVLEKNGAQMNGDSIKIPFETIEPVAIEVGFKDHYPVDRYRLGERLDSNTPELQFEFTGNGFVLQGWVRSAIEDVDANVEISVDGGSPETVTMPTKHQMRRLELAWKYQLAEENHTVKIRLMNPKDGLAIDVGDLIVYSSNKIENTWKTN